MEKGAVFEKGAIASPGDQPELLQSLRPELLMESDVVHEQLVMPHAVVRSQNECWWQAWV